MPALEDSDSTTQAIHDLDQWKFVASLIGLSDLTVVGANRLSRPTHLTSLNAPRLLRITFLTEEMKEKALAKRSHAQSRLPLGIKYHSDRPRESRAECDSIITLDKVMTTKINTTSQVHSVTKTVEQKNGALPSFQ